MIADLIGAKRDRVRHKTKLIKFKMRWVWGDEVRSLFKIDNCDLQTCECPAQKNNTQKQIDKIQNVVCKAATS